MRTWAVTLLILVLLLAGYGVYANFITEPAVETAGAPATARARQGDLLISVAGSGELAAQEISLAFPITGQISEVLVAPDSAVAAGERLARLDSRQAELDFKAAQLAWDILNTPQAIAVAQQQVLVLQQELSEAQEELAFIQDGPPVWYYENLLAEAEAEYLELKNQYLGAVARNDRRAIGQLGRAVERALQAVEEAEQDLDWVKAYQPDAQDLALAEARFSLAEARLAAQEQLLSVLSGSPLPAPETNAARNDALMALEKASLALQKAQWTLNQTWLVAPAAGAISQVFAAPGERANGQPVMALTPLNSLQVLFYVEESDLAILTAGARAEVRLESYPQQAFPAVVTRIDPALVSVDGSMMAQAWAQFETPPPVALYPGMSLEVEVIAAEAKDVMLVPLQALRQNSDGTYFVEVLQPDNSFAATPVSIGLKDLANVQILSGLIEGDQVSTESK